VPTISEHWRAMARVFSFFFVRANLAHRVQTDGVSSHGAFALECPGHTRHQRPSRQAHPGARDRELGRIWQYPTGNPLSKKDKSTSLGGVRYENGWPSFRAHTHAHRARRSPSFFDTHAHTLSNGEPDRR